MVKILVAGFLVAGILFMAGFAYFYVKYEGIVDRRMAGPLFNNSAKIYARPRTIDVGNSFGAQQIADYLRRAGYSEQDKDSDSPIGRFRLSSGSIEVMPGEESFHAPENATIHFAGGKVASIMANGRAGQSLTAYELEPQMITSLFGGVDRSKRQIVTFDAIPANLVNAVIAIEDRRFFQHSGVNYYRLMEAAASDILHGHRGQGGSTLTMQLSRGFFLTPEKTVKRKLTEMLISVELEQKFSKQRIFEMYANQVPMGQRGSFSINGFGEASRAYFNKDMKDLTLPECALLAGIIQRPSYLSPYRHPERALERRNLVLDSMVETDAITRDQADRAKATSLKLAAPNVEASDAPYFVDLVKDQLSNQYNESELNEQAMRIYTTLDPDLQRAAAEAVEVGMKLVDEQILKKRTHKTKVGTGSGATTEVNVDSGPLPQVAVVVLDPHTGEVLALVGGRNYGTSQLNHAVAKRPTGSIFKPFVYAAAVNTALTGQMLSFAAANPETGGNSPPTIDTSGKPGIFTPATLVDDSQVSIAYGDQVYEPRNYHEAFHGEVTARYALAMSLNNATVKVAQGVGFGAVASLAKAAGITSVRATPAIALGSYDASPLEMSGAYTVFSNGGTRVSPSMLTSVRDARGSVLSDYHNDPKAVLDPRVAYVMTTMMQSVIDNGTGSTVRARGFTAPAAGKTGTSHDAWFAGYTSNLLCVVWVGNDDYTDIKLAGGSTAAPIWAEFMKRAQKIPQYSDMKGFPAPSGVVQVQLDKITNRLATPACPQTYYVAFIAGTEPKETCEQAFSDHRGFFSKILGLGSPEVAPPPTTNGSAPAQQSGAVPGQASASQGGVQPAAEQKKKKGFFSRVFGGKGNDQNQNENSNAAPPPDKGNKTPPE
ncbi:MAG TPA: transglycosylase domain-containing protein [Terriglobales bacterium]